MVKKYTCTVTIPKSGGTATINLCPVNKLPIPMWGFAPGDCLEFNFVCDNAPYKESCKISPAPPEYPELFTKTLPFNICDGDILTFSGLPKDKKSIKGGFSLKSLSGNLHIDWLVDPECSVSSGY
jgi:hypothetical protein